MSGLRLIMKCVAEAACAKGLKALAGLVPFGEVAYEIAENALERWRQARREDRMQADLEELVRTGRDEENMAAVEVAGEVAAGQPEAIRQGLTALLAQMPDAARRSLRRPADPTGRSVPGGTPLSRPEHLLALLPQRLTPRFKAGDRPAGVGSWELVELLGVGGFGEVWKAEHPRFKSIPPVALKFCLDDSLADALRHEAALLDRVMAQADTAGMVPLKQAHLDADPPCLEYEFVNGGDLTGLFRDFARMTPAKRVVQAALVVRKLAAVVGRMHRLSPPIVHRDLKPANVLVRRREGAKFDLLVADFGIGGVAAGRALDRSRRSETSRGALMATCLRGSHTPLYASPQQRRGEDPAPRDDVYALGVIWFQLLAADPAAEPGFNSLEELRDEGMSEGGLRLLGACLDHKRERRPADGTELAGQLDTILRTRVIARPDDVVLPLAPEEATPAPSPNSVAVPLPGIWSTRPANLEDELVECTKTPDSHLSVHGQETHFQVNWDATDASLEVLAGLRGLQSLDLGWCTKLTDAGLARLVGLTDLRELDLSGCPGITSESLAVLARLSGLQTLHLGGCPKLTDNCLDSLRDMGGLLKLDLSGCPNIFDPGLTTLAGLTGLRELDLSGSPNITDAGMAALAGLSGLQALGLRGCPNITDAGLAPLAGLIGLLKLDLNRCPNITDGGLTTLAGLTGLRELDLGGCPNITDSGLAALTGLSGLQTLALTGCSNITDAGLIRLSGLTDLRKLNLGGCPNITDVGLIHLSGLTGLRKLDLGGCRNITDAGLAPLAALTGLQHLSLTGCSNITDAGLVRLSGLTGLRKLDLGGCPNITDSGLVPLAGFTALQSLSLTGCSNITDAGLIRLSGLTDLRELDLGRCSNITDVGLIHLSGLTGLRELDLGGCRNVTDAGLTPLAGLTSLRRLDLDNCMGVTDTGLLVLTGLTGLRVLLLEGCCNLTDDGLTELREALPDCEIIE